jgi:hypothetical protein
MLVLLLMPSEVEAQANKKRKQSVPNQPSQQSRPSVPDDAMATDDLVPQMIVIYNFYGPYNASLSPRRLRRNRQRIVSSCPPGFQCPAPRPGRRRVRW